MNALVKRRWLQALRSGKVEQGRGALMQSKGGIIHYDALGILCTMCGVPFNEAEPDADGRYSFGEDKYQTFLPPEARKASGLSEPNPSFQVPEDVAEQLTERAEQHGYPLTIHDHHTVTVSALNDAGFTFSEIADLIERYL